MPTDEPLPVAERLIREAIERGEFDRLPGAGKPIPDLDREYDAGWWAKRYVQRMKVEDALREIRQQVRHELPRLRAMTDREMAKKRLDELNALIAEINGEVPPDQRLDPVTLDG